MADANAEHDALLEELQGGKSTSVKKLDPQTTTKDDPLAVKSNAPAPTAVQRADKKHATRNNGGGYAVIVRGEYYAAHPDFQGKNLAKPYEIEVNLPSLDKAMSVIKNKLLAPMLKKKFSDYVRYRTYKVADVRPLSPSMPPAKNLKFAAREALVEYATENRVPIDTNDYPDTEILREALVDFALNPKGFVEREKQRQADRKETAELAAMNPDIAAAGAGAK